MFPEVNVYIALLACGVAFLGITMTLTTGDQFRNVVLKYGKPTFTQILPSVTTNGVFLGGVMMWSVHMIGFVSMTWKDNDGNVVPIHFNTAVCLLGLIFSVIMSSVGGFIAGKDKLYAKSKAEILDHFVAIVSADNLLNYSEYEVLVLLMTKELRYILYAGTFIGIGGVGVFFIIVASMEFPGYIAWNGGILFAALLIIFPSTMGGSWMFFRFFSVYHNIESFRLANSVFASIAVTGTHYFLAILAADFRIDYNRTSAQPWSTGSVNKDDLLFLLLLAAMIITWMFAMLIFADMRSKINSYRSYLQKACPNEQLSDILRAAENGLEKSEASSGHGKKNAVAPHTFNEHESPV